MTTALLTDRYELTMLDAALEGGLAERRCVFEVFTRALPAGRRYGVFAGLGRLVPALADLRFDDATLAWLDDEQVVRPATLGWLAGYRFRGELYAYREGEPYVAGSPVLTVVGSFAEAVLLETLVLSVLNHDSAIAAAAARVVAAAGGRGLLEFGSRRTHEEAAVAAGRAAYLTGFDGTSNLAAGARYGVPTLGTTAHAFVLLHDDEPAAIAQQLAAAGEATTVLVDTYDTTRAIATALELAGPALGAIRIDSGDLAAEARAARAQLDAAGATSTRIVVSGDLDEHRVAALADAPIDAYGVGTRLVMGSGAPNAGFVYKLVAREGRHGALEPVAKAGGPKATLGGRKRASRRLRDGLVVSEVVRPWDARVPPEERALQIPVLTDGTVVHAPDPDEVRAHHRAAMSELPASALALEPGDPGWILEEERP
ncbi:MAG: nicotinate phosphoribosyltransferase [Nitriliruptoraceae bacterium]